MSRLKINLIIGLCYTVFALLLIIPRYVIVGSADITFWIGLFVGILLYFAYPIGQMIFKRNWPILLQIIICTQTIMGLTFASAFLMYSRIPFWDLILHGLLGVEATIFGYFILLNTIKGKMNLFGQIVFITTFVLGVAATWEIIEYIGYNLTGHDFQHFIEYPSKDTPLDDTMTDLIIALIVNLLCYLFILVDYLGFKGKCINKIKKGLILEDEKENINELQ